MSDYRTCGACYELVHKYASICPHCHTQLTPDPQPRKAGLKDWVTFFVLFGLVYYFFVWPYLNIK